MFWARIVVIGLSVAMWGSLLLAFMGCGKNSHKTITIPEEYQGEPVVVVYNDGTELVCESPVIIPQEEDVSEKEGDKCVKKGKGHCKHEEDKEDKHK